jgi:hypothetical protein
LLSNFVLIALIASRCISCLFVLKELKVYYLE